MKIYQRVPAIIFITLSVVAMGISIYCVIKAVQWVNKPFAGFLVYDPPYVGSFSTRDWPGKKAGLTYLDRIITVDWQEVRSGQEIMDIVRQKNPGTLVNYQVESKGERREVNVPVVLFGWMDFFLLFVTPFTVMFAITAIGFVVYILKPGTQTSWVFFIMCYGLGMYGLTGFEIHSSYTLLRYHYLMLSIFPFAMLHLGMIFPDKKKFIVRYPIIEYLIYVPAVILAAAYQIYFSTYPDIIPNSAYTWLPGYSQLSSYARIFTLAGALALIAFVLWASLRSPNIISRFRARMILFGACAAFLPSAMLMALVYYLKVYFPWNFLVFFLVVFPLSIAYSIVRHNLFDADVIIRRSVGYAVVTLAVIGIYLVISLSLNVWAGQYQLAQSQMFPILFTIGIILVFNPLHRYIQNFVDRVFFRKEYNAGEIIDRIGNAVTHLMEVPQILQMLVRTFMEDMFLETSSVMLTTPDGKQFKVMLAGGTQRESIEGQVIDRESPLLKIIDDQKKEITRYDLMENPRYKKLYEPGKSHFDDLDASLMIPLLYQDEVIGTFNLGEKKSGKPFNRDDIELLRNLANQGAIAIENARLFEENLEKQRMEEELNIARDLQMSMLPATCPEIEGLQIAASSTPAMEVGGDFYDFIGIAEDRIGLVIGDVTGKSVSGALVMSSSRSVFRMLSEEELPIDEIMGRANRRIKNDIKAGMFVALLFAIVDAPTRKLSLCSAGQTQPIHICARTGESRLLETEGDTFPLGILAEADYRQTEVPLAAGDRLIFYTDGIVEAMNDDKEIYGFERLLEVAKGAQNQSAQDLLTTLTTEVATFVGGAKQHDDLTIIVLGVEK